MYGNLFVSKFGVGDTNGVWLKTLETLTPKALESGLTRLVNLSNNGKFAEFPPNCLQFKALCLAFYEDLQLPTAGAAYREIQARLYSTNCLWSHRVIKFIAYRLPANFYYMEEEHKAYGAFKEAYEQVCNMVRQGHEIPETPEVLPIIKPVTQSVARHHLSLIKKRLSV